jgi:hypothetical protein
MEAVMAAIRQVKVVETVVTTILRRQVAEMKKTDGINSLALWQYCRRVNHI